jgi:hypothetical protein
MLRLRAPLQSGTDTEIDMIEREMEGGVIVEQPLEIHEHSDETGLGGPIEVEDDVTIRDLD